MKKNVLNRILSMALALSMSLALSVPAFATNDGGDWAKENESAGYSFAGRTEEVLLVDDGKGNLVEVIGKLTGIEKIALFKDGGKRVFLCSRIEFIN